MKNYYDTYLVIAILSGLAAVLMLAGIFAGEPVQLPFLRAIAISCNVVTCGLNLGFFIRQKQNNKK